MSHLIPLLIPLTQLKGVGAQTLLRLQKLGLNSVRDLLFHLPLRYEDHTRIHPLGQLVIGDRVLVEGRVEQAEILHRTRRSLICRISDGSGYLTLRFFHFSARQLSTMEQGVLLRCFGEVRSGYQEAEMVHPEYQRVTESAAGETDGALTPIYPLTEGVHQKTLRNLIAQALQLYDEPVMAETLRDWIPSATLAELRFPPLIDAIRLLHAPSAGSLDDADTLQDPATQQAELARVHQAIINHTHPAQQRLAFEELLAHHLSLTRPRRDNLTRRAPLFQDSSSAQQALLDHLPFDLTGAQRRVIAQIQTDLASGQPMLRLVQGDVGSGKTIVAAYCALSALAANYQTALMAPTELLAEQHYRNFSEWLSPLEVTVTALTGKHKGKEREKVLEAIHSGQAGVVIGTHALFQEKVNFHQLGFVIIDEQHRFGVDQRLALRAKGVRDGLYPHQLIMTATPIPRTLAMLSFSEMEISLIDELPPGRTPVKTSVIPATRRHEVIERIERWVKGGRQVYWVCTLIEESDALQCEAAEETLEQLQQQLPGVRVALLHGRMKSAEKELGMCAFKQGEVDLLVATTVIEVGVDVPNAGLMIIENPERLGLSQLHQLRGRVGRGSEISYCLLIYQPPLSETAYDRLSIVRNSNDGFEIAEKDLALRGPGEMMGTRQTGQIQFRIADLARDGGMLPQVLKTAEQIHQAHPEAIEPLIERWLGDGARYAEV